jgi:hypothetical protein
MNPCYLQVNVVNLSSARTENASFGQILRSRNFSILDVAPLRLRSKNSCGLVFDQNLHFPFRHQIQKMTVKSPFEKGDLGGF